MDSTNPEVLIKHVAEVDILSSFPPESRDGAIRDLETILTKWRARELLSLALCCTLPSFVAFPDASFVRLQALIRLVYTPVNMEKPNPKFSSRLNVLRGIGPVEFAICGLTLTEKMIKRMGGDIFNQVINEAKKAAPEVKSILLSDERAGQAVQQAGVPEFTTSRYLRFVESK